MFPVITLPFCVFTRSHSIIDIFPPDFLWPHSEPASAPFSSHMIAVNDAPPASVTTITSPHLPNLGLTATQ